MSDVIILIYKHDVVKRILKEAEERKMKKLLMVLAATLMFGTCRAAVPDDITLVGKDYVDIHGSGADKNANVTLLIMKNGKTIDDYSDKNADCILYVDQTKTNANGEYSFKVNRNGIQNGLQYMVYQGKNANKAVDVSKISADNEIENKRALNVVEYGADNTGNEDSTYILTKLHGTGKMIYYPSGTYRFNGKNLDLSGGVVFENTADTKVVNDISDENILQFDDNGRLIGLMHNHLELDDSTMGSGWRMNIGNIEAPPVSTANYKTKVDFIPYWYNDFGLDKTVSTAGTYRAWYYWSWNFHKNISDDPTIAYDPSRHPLLGFYRGDDKNVLDWQCYWLREYGAKAATLLSGTGGSGVTGNWQTPSDSNYWIYQLFNNVPNFKGLGYIMQMRANFVPLEDTDDAEAIRANERNFVTSWWNDVIDNIYLKYDNCYCIEKNGKKYPAVWLFEEGAIFGTFDNYGRYGNGTGYTKEFLKSIADKLKAKGYGGLALLVRNPSDAFSSNDPWFEQNGVLRYITSYESVGSGSTYDEVVNNYSPTVSSDTILNASTGMYTHKPHPSGWNVPGNTPELFGKLIEKQVEVIENNDIPKIITCYNMAEWAEGGPGLQPNVKDRFGYLEAMKDAIVENPQMNINTVWYDENKIPMSKITSKENLIQKTDIYNTCYDGKTATVITALYKDKKLVSTTCKTVELTSKKTKTEQVLTKEQLEGVTQIKVMAFENEKNIIPLSAINAFD